MLHGASGTLARQWMDYLVSDFDNDDPCITVGINQGFHGYDGLNTTQLVLVFDSDVGCFSESSCGCTAWFVVFAISTTRLLGSE